MVEEASSDLVAVWEIHLADGIHMIEFEHGGQEYDDRYPDGIPTSMTVTLDGDRSYDSGLIMYPSGHARNTTCDLEDILAGQPVGQPLSEAALGKGKVAMPAAAVGTVPAGTAMTSWCRDCG